MNKKTHKTTKTMFCVSFSLGVLLLWEVGALLHACVQRPISRIFHPWLKPIWLQIEGIYGYYSILQYLKLFIWHLFIHWINNVTMNNVQFIIAKKDFTYIPILQTGPPSLKLCPSLPLLHSKVYVTSSLLTLFSCRLPFFFNHFHCHFFPSPSLFFLPLAALSPHLAWFCTLQLPLV